MIASKMNFKPEIDSKRTHDLELERDRLRLIPASTNSSFKPGTCVRIEGFVEKPKYNGMLGQVKKLIEDNRYRVMLSSEKTEFAIEGKFLVGINNCVSDQRITGGILIWPDVARSNFPAVQHFDDDGFRGKFVNPFSHIQDRVDSRGFGDLVATKMRSDFYNDSDNRQKMAQSFLPLYDIFKKRLGWTIPSFKPLIGPFDCDIVFYDKASEGKPNRWFEASYNGCSVSKINGAFVIIQHLDKPVAIQRSLNYERWFFGNFANGEWKNLYQTCVRDPDTVFGRVAEPRGETLRGARRTPRRAAPQKISEKFPRRQIKK